jgi:monoterpene epsilon-lactone hydrolase
VKLYNRSYVGDNDPRSPLISPVFGDLHGLPPLLVHAGEEEILLDDARRITRLAESAGVDVRLEVYSRMWHVWQLFLGLPQAQQSLSDISQFLHSHLAGREQPSSSG